MPRYEETDVLHNALKEVLLDGIQVGKFSTKLCERISAVLLKHSTEVKLMYDEGEECVHAWVVQRYLRRNEKTYCGRRKQHFCNSLARSLRLALAMKGYRGRYNTNKKVPTTDITNEDIPLPFPFVLDDSALAEQILL